MSLECMEGLLLDFASTEEIVVVGKDPCRARELEAPFPTVVNDAQLGSDCKAVGSEIDLIGSFRWACATDSIALGSYPWASR